MAREGAEVGGGVQQWEDDKLRLLHFLPQQEVQDITISAVPGGNECQCEILVKYYSLFFVLFSI